MQWLTQPSAQSFIPMPSCWLFKRSEFICIWATFFGKGHYVSLHWACFWWDIEALTPLDESNMQLSLTNTNMRWQKTQKNRWQMIQNMGWQMTEWQMKHNHWSDPLGWKQYAAFPHNSRHRVSAHPVVQFLGIFSFGSGSRLHLVRLTASSAQTLCCKSKSIEANTCVDQCEECLLHLITRRVRGKRIRIKACNLPPWNLVIACEDQPSLQTQDTMHTLSHLHKICHFFGFGGKCVELKGGKKTKKRGSCVEGSPCAHTITLPEAQRTQGIESITQIIMYEFKNQAWSLKLK